MNHVLLLDSSVNPFKTPRAGMVGAGCLAPLCVLLADDLEVCPQQREHKRLDARVGEIRVCAVAPFEVFPEVRGAERRQGV